MNYFELYPGDYLRDTTRLTLIEHGAFLRLLMVYYAEEQPLPADADELYVITAAIKPADKAAVKKIADRFFPVGADGLRHNKRADEEIAKAQKRMATSRDNGTKGGRPKKPKENPPGNPAGNPVGSKSSGFSEPVTNPERTHSGEALQTPDPSIPPDGSLRAEGSGGARAAADIADELPDGVNPGEWALFELHHQQQRRWSIARRMLAFAQLRELRAAGADPNGVLTWATSRGLSDLADAARRMAADAAKETEHATDFKHTAGRRESDSERSARVNAEIDAHERRAAGQ